MLYLTADDTSGILPLNFSFNYFKVNYTQVKISTNGYLVFSPINITCYITRPIPTNSIIAYNIDLYVNSGSGGGTYYNYISPFSNEMASLQLIINLVDQSFVPKNAFEVIWFNVTDYGSRNLLDYGSTRLKISLATDFQNSYVLIQNMLCFNNLVLNSIPGLNCINSSGTLREIPNTNKSSNEPCISSNVGKAGTWIFEVSGMDCKY